MKNFKYLIIFTLILAGCDNQHDIDSFNKSSLSTPEFVGYINKNAVNRYTIKCIEMDGDTRYHYIYIIDNNKTISDNFSYKRQDGKFQHIVSNVNVAQHE